MVECNECWASGIYSCDPAAVLKTLLLGNVDFDTINSRDWDFQRHYAFAVSKHDKLNEANLFDDFNQQDPKVVCKKPWRLT